MVLEGFGILEGCRFMGSFAPAGLGDGGLGKRRSVQGILQVFSFHYLCDLALAGLLLITTGYAVGPSRWSDCGAGNGKHGTIPKVIGNRQNRTRSRIRRVNGLPSSRSINGVVGKPLAEIWRLPVNQPPCSIVPFDGGAFDGFGIRLDFGSDSVAREVSGICRVGPSSGQGFLFQGGYCKFPGDLISSD